MSTYPKYSYEIPLVDFNLDCNRRVKTAALCDFLQVGATVHAERLGVGMLDLQASGLTWMIAKMDIAFENWPRPKDTLSLETWPSGVRGHLICNRDFLMRDSAGNVVLRARSEWVVVNWETRHVAKLTPALMALAPADVPRVEMPEMPAFDAKSLAGGGEVLLPVRRADLDLNMHVNNVHYIEWIFEPLSDEAYRRSLKRLSITYHAEARAGETVASSYSETALEGGGFVTSHALKRDGTALTKATCVWA